MHLPEDPVMLMSVINMRLRDEGVKLSELCCCEGVDICELKDRLSRAGFVYDEEHNCFS